MCFFFSRPLAWNYLKQNQIKLNFPTTGSPTLPRSSLRRCHRNDATMPPPWICYLFFFLLLPLVQPFGAPATVCEWPDAPELSLAAGRIPLFDDGLLQLRTDLDAQVPIAVTLLDEKISFTNYYELKATVEDAFAAGSSSLDDPILADYRKAIEMVERYGDALETLVERHPGYGMENILRQVVGTAPSSPDNDIGLRYMREGVVDIPKARVYDPTFNCTAGFSLMNASLVTNESRVVYTSEEYDYQGGRNVEKCPFFDAELGCYVDPAYEQHPKGECCNVAPYTQRAILMGDDQFYPGTCEADIICPDGDISDAVPCGDGFVCDEMTTANGSSAYPCAPGYVCGFGTTPDPTLEAPSGQFDKLCPERYQCEAGTGVEERDSPCPPNYFCPTGTAAAKIGSMANDALNRGLDLSSEGESRLRVYGVSRIETLDCHDSICLEAADESVAETYEVQWKRPGDGVNSHLEYLSRVEDRNDDGIIDPPYVSNPDVSHLQGAARPEVVNVADILASQCERDDKSRLVADAIRRQECNCTEQLFTLATIYRLWQCTSTEPLADFGIAALQVLEQQGRGHRDFWFDRIHRDYDIAVGMDKAMEGYGLKWGDGPVCNWPDNSELSLVGGRIPGFANGLLSFPDRRNASLKLPFTWLEDRSFSTYEELKRAVYDEYANQLNLTALVDAPIDPFIYDLHHSVNMIEQFGAKLESLVSLRQAVPEERFMPWGQRRDEYNASSSQLVPGRLDVCACQDLLKCPNGTHFYGTGAASIDDCKTNGNEVLRRVSLLPPEIRNNSTRVRNGTDFAELGGGHESNAIAILELESLEVAIFNLDLTALPTNMTYHDHYRIAVYVDCMPCPPRYRCEKSAGVESSCSLPTQEQQIEKLNDCLRRERRQVCVKFDGSDADVEWCREQAARFEDETEVSEEQADFESTFLLYTEPDLHKCLSMPYFCDDTKWNYRTFRRLCQETLSDGRLGQPYDCSLTDRWKEYEQWSNDLCCSSDPEFQGLAACTNGTCADDSQIHDILRDKFATTFRQSFGFDPPEAAPQGSFVMDATLQEDRDHPTPLDLFNEWKNGPAEAQEALKPHNIYRASESTPWREEPGCCQCQPHPLPGYFDSTIKDSGFPDNKHQQVQFTIAALENVDLTVVVELLHGQYYPDFDEYFSPYDKSQLRVHTPSRFTSKDERATWMAILDREVVDAVPLELPLNLPTTKMGGVKVFENRILIDRPSALDIGRFDLGEGGEVIESGKLNTSDYFLSDDHRLPIPPHPVLDNAKDVQERPQWWETGDETAQAEGVSQEMSFIALPYLPFFSNCDGYDSHMSISRLLEEHPNCTIVSRENTRPVNQYRLFNRMRPVSDYCQDETRTRGIDLRCSYEEDLVAPRERYRWYESSRETVLFHLTSDAIQARIFEAERNDDGLVTKRWGRGSEIDLLRDSYRLVPVTVDFAKDSMRNVLPRTVELELEYYQYNKGQKRLVDASIRFENLCTTIKPRHFGGNAELLGAMAARGIEPCEVDISGKIKSRQYKLKVNFHALGWFRLLNRYQFNAPIYLMFFSLVGIVAVIMGATVWGGSRLTTKLRYPALFRFFGLARLVARPSCVGCLIAIIPMVVCLSMTNLPANSLRSIDGSWLGSNVLDKSRIESNHAGRIGSALLAVGIYLSVLAAKLLIPEFRRKRLGEREIEPSSLNNGDDDEGKDGGDQEPWTPAIWRRSHLLFTSMCLQFILITVMEFSYSVGFETNVFGLIVLLKVFFLVLELVLGTVLKETLIAAPLLVVVEITQILVTMGAADFFDFTLSHFVGLALIIAERLFVNPAVKRVKTLLPRWKLMFVRRFTRLRQLSDEEKEREEEAWKKVNEDIEMHCEGVEPFLDSLGIYSIESTGSLLSPFVFLFLMAFYRHTCVADKYGVEENELSYYTLFAFYMIPWSLAVDVFILNAQELVYGWRIYDYLSYQRYRFATRHYRWMLNSLNVDESISESLQTLDLMCFSSQYYFLSSIFVIGMMSTMFGITVFLRYEFNFLGDPATPIVAMSMCMVCEGVRRGMIYASTAKIDYLEWRGLWATREIEGTMDDAVAARLAVGVGSQAGLEQERLELQALNSERFRTRFVERNRPWILQHLVEMIPAEVIRTMPPDGVEKIRDMYSDLTNLGQGLRKPGDRPDISSDTDEDEDERERRRQWDRAPLRGQQVEVARNWLQRAQKRLAFGRVVQGIVENNRSSSCSFCNRKSHQCKSLAVSLARDGDRNPYALDDLIRSFEDEYGAEESNLDLWKAFFRANASFVTTCDVCISNSSQRKALKADVRVARAVDISSDEDSDSDNDEKISFDPVVMEQSSSDAMTRWLEVARARLGGGGGVEFPTSEAKKRADLYRRNLKRRADRQKGGGGGGGGGESRPTFGDSIEIADVGKSIMADWLSNARQSKSKRDVAKGKEIRQSLDDALSKMSPDEDWFYTKDLRERGSRNVEQGKRLDAERARLEKDKDDEVDAVKTNLASIKADADDTLEASSIQMNQELEEASRKHHQALAERELEVRRAGGLSEEEVDDELAREQRRLEETLVKKKEAIQQRHQTRQEETLKRVALAEENAAAVIRNSEQRFEFTTSGPEREYRAAALAWIEVAQRRILAKARATESRR